MTMHTSYRDISAKPFDKEKRYSSLYHYTSFEKFIKIWDSQSLKFGEIQNLNDINEKHKMTSIPIINSPFSESHYKEILKMTNDEIYRYRQISLTKDYSSAMKGCMSTMMWGHYGDKGRGVCFELDFSKLSFPKKMFYKEIKYKRLLKDVTDLNPNLLIDPNKIELFVRRHISDIYFTKSQEWKGENEFRIISKAYNLLDISDAITAIYVTDCNSAYCKCLERLVDGKVPVFCLRTTGIGGHRVFRPIKSSELRMQLYEPEEHRKQMVKTFKKIKI